MSAQIFCAAGVYRKSRKALASFGCVLVEVTAIGFSMRIVEDGTM